MYICFVDTVPFVDIHEESVYITKKSTCHECNMHLYTCKSCKNYKYIALVTTQY